MNKKGVLQKSVKGICSGIHFAMAGDEVEIMFDHNNVQLVRKVTGGEIFPTQTNNILPSSEQARILLQEVPKVKEQKSTTVRKQKTASPVKVDAGQSSLF